MSGVDEALALEQVSEGLASRFPMLDPTTVKSVVREVHASLDGPVRDYVPLLVERVSRERLHALASGATSRHGTHQPRGTLTSA
jgi:hypothetical protein